MAISRWDPWQEVGALERQFDELLGRVRRQERGGAPARSWMPSIDVHQDGADLVIRAELAGVAPEDVELTIEDGVLHLSGSREDDQSVSEGDWIRRERFSGRFERDIALPDGVDAEAITAKADNGVVEVRVPCPSAPEPRKVPLTTNDEAKSVDVSTAGGRQDSASTDASAQS